VPQMDAAEAELAVEAPRATAQFAAIAMPPFELQLLTLFCDLRSGRHSSLLARERHAELAQHVQRTLVIAGRRHDGDVHSLGLLDLVVVHLGEDQMVANAQRIVAPAVEALARNAAEVADP